MTFGALSASVVSAAAPEFLLQIPADSVAPGPGVGETDNPRGMATNPETGHLYVSDLTNARIDEFTAWGVFVKAWGWDVAPDGAPGDTVADQLEVCTSSCQAGERGTGTGQFGFIKGITVDGAGDVYVHESNTEGEDSFRVQKFDDAGNFLLTFGGDVNRTKVEEGAPLAQRNLCPVAPGDVCQAGVPGTADGQFSNTSVGNYVDYNPVSNTIFVGDKDRIQEFGLNGAFLADIDFDVPGELEAFDGESVEALAADPPSGDLYVAFNGTADVYRLDRTSGEILDDPLTVQLPTALAVDVVGGVYVVNNGGRTLFGGKTEVLGFDAAGEPVEGMEAEDGFAAPPSEKSDTPQIHGVATNVLGPGSEEPGDVYVNYFNSGSRSYVKAYGPAPIAFEDPPTVPPEIKAQYAVSVTTKGAVLRAQINPRFWADTTYYVQYGTAPCSAGGCKARPAPPGASLTTKSINAFLTTAGVFLPDLQPDTTYYYRFVTQSSGSNHEEVMGVGGKPGEPGAEATFKTFALAGPVNGNCPNSSFRTGPSERLPDCRAYEMVSPLDKNNADIVTQLTLAGFTTSLNQSSDSGESFTYSSGTAFGNPGGASFVAQLLANRSPSGWISDGLAPPRTRSVVDPAPLDNEFKAFSKDLCLAWLRTEFDPPLAPGGVEGYRNLYRRDNCGSGKGAFKALTTVEPPHIEKVVNESYVGLQFLGASADGSRSIFVAPDNLPGTDAPPNENQRLQLYEHSEDGQLRFVCILPSGNPTGQACYAGTATEAFGGRLREGSFQNAISVDGERIFWTDASGVGPGRIFVRFVDEPKSRRVSQSATGAKARFWGAAADGSRAIFAIEDIEFPLQDENLYSFDVDGDDATLVAGSVKGVLGVNEDATHVYFVSTEALAGAGGNSEGDEAVPGQMNLYLYEEGVGSSFIGIPLSNDELTTQKITAITKSPFFHTSRVSPDGRHAAFMSTAPLTGYDNTDAVSGKTDAEVFLYDADEDELRCASCNPTKARPTGVDLRTIYFVNTELWAAARIPGWETPFFASRALSADGNRLFFESFEALAPRDTNGVADVYQWEAPGSGDCDVGDPSFGEEAGGCVELISSGESPRSSTFLDADPSGSNVFIATLGSLVPPDYGLVDVYDARVGGGFAYPKPEPPCEGEACQSPPAPPEEQTPSSATLEGARNQSKPKPRCPKGKRRVVRKGKARCVKRSTRQHKRGKHQRRASHRGGAAR